MWLAAEGPQTGGGSGFSHVGGFPDSCPCLCLLSAVTEEDTRRLIELRAANEVLFTGRRNTAKPVWRLASQLAATLAWR